MVRRIVAALLFVLFLAVGGATCAAAPASQVVVLMYHHLAPENPQNLGAVISPQAFADQMRYLSEHGYQTISLQQLRDYLDGKSSLPAKSVLITFDDGYESVYEFALPILKQYEQQATVFVIGSSVRWNDEPFPAGEVPKLTGSQMREMAESGLIEFGYHTYDAHRKFGSQTALTRYSGAALAEDIAAFAQAFDALGIAARKAIAYPFGVSTPSLISKLQEHGYELGFTVKSGYVRAESSPMLLHRIAVTPPVTLKRFADIMSDGQKTNQATLLINNGPASLSGDTKGQAVDPYLSSGRWMVPLRFVAEQLGAIVDWRDSTSEVLIKGEGPEVRITMDGQKRIWIGEKEIFPDKAPELKSGNVFVPLRVISECLGYRVDWHPDSNTIAISR